MIFVNRRQLKRADELLRVAKHLLLRLPTINQNPLEDAKLHHLTFGPVTGPEGRTGDQVAKMRRGLGHREGD